MNHFLLFVFLIASFLSFGFGSIEPFTKWENPEIEVCWWDYETQVPSYLKTLDSRLSEIITFDYYRPRIMTDKRKLIVKEIINANYKKEATGIHFTGWKNCSESESSRVILFGISGFQQIKQITGDVFSLKNQKGPYRERNQTDIYSGLFHGRASIGNRLKDQKINAFLIIQDNLLSQQSFTDEFLELTAIHEFGHLAGLRHEHIRIEKAYSDPLCELSRQFNHNGVHEGPDKTTLFTSEYDQKSIMNYCYLKNLSEISKVMKLGEVSDHYQIKLIKDILNIQCDFNQKDCFKGLVKLSQGDIHALQCLYVFEEEQFQKNCHKDQLLIDNH